jgi:hypothetical protein
VSWRFPERIGGSVRRELGRFGPAGAMGEIVAAWPTVVGPSIAENAWPARSARDGTLTVATSSSVWAFELTKLEASIRDRLAEALGDAAPPRLRFVPGRLPERGVESVSPSPQAPRRIDALAREAGTELAAPIEDEELRDLVARAAAASLSRRYAGPDDRPLW